MQNSITFIGLDGHKETMSVALVEADDRGEAWVYGEIALRPDALKTLMSRLAHDRGDLRFRSAHQRMINRRFTILSPALPVCSHLETLARHAADHPWLLLEMANMNVS